MRFRKDQVLGALFGLCLGLVGVAILALAFYSQVLLREQEGAIEQ